MLPGLGIEYAKIELYDSVFSIVIIVPGLWRIDSNFIMVSYKFLNRSIEIVYCNSMLQNFCMNSLINCAIKCAVNFWLVVWVLSILKNISQWEGLSHILWKIKNVWNHQQDFALYSIHDQFVCGLNCNNSIQHRRVPPPQFQVHGREISDTLPLLNDPSPKK